MENTPHRLIVTEPGAPVPYITPVDGWALHTWIERDSDGFNYPEYAAVRGGEVRRLNVSRFRFSPSQDRFAWLVRNSFPQSPGVGPWDDTDIEMRMAIPAVAA